jgi:hypothetical protein
MPVRRVIGYRKYKELAHMECSKNPISQRRFDISPIWIPLFIDEVTKSKGLPRYPKCLLVYILSPPNLVLTSLM